MTTQLFKTKKEAQEECNRANEIIHKSKLKPIKIRYDIDDWGRFGVKGFGFDAIDGQIYYIMADSKAQVNSWKLNSKVL